MNELFLGVMDLQEAKNHQYRLKNLGIELILKTNPQTCTSGCKITVEVWGSNDDQVALQQHFQADYLKNLKGHIPNFDHLAAVYDPTLSEVTCQACGTNFSPKMNECPDCGLVY